MRSALEAIVSGLMARCLLRYFGALAIRGMEVAGKFGLYLLAARLMGGRESGLLFLCLTWVNFASTAARMGLERAMSRHIAAELAVGRGQAARHALVSGLGWTALASLAAAILTFGFASPAALYLYHEPELAWPLRLTAFVLPAQTLAFAVGFVLIGLSRGVSAQLVQSGLPALLPLAALLAGWRNVGTVLLVYAGSYAVCCCIGGGFVLRDWQRVMLDRVQADVVEPEPLATLSATARPFLVIELVQATLLALPVLVLGAFADAVAVSAFSIVNRMTMMINTILVSIAMIAAPAFARHHRRREFAQLRQSARQARWLASVVCLPIIAVMVLIPRQLLSLLGHEFIVAAPAMIVLCVGQFVNTLFPTEDMMLAMTGHGSALCRLNLQQLIVCCGLSAALIPILGLMGAAIVTSVCLMQGRLSFAIAVHRVLPELSLPLAETA